jgi:hydrogenase maturation protein HypF
VAALVGLRMKMRFEGQAAMELEFVLEGIQTDAAYELPLSNSAAADASGHTRHAARWLDWSPMLEQILDEVARGVPVGVISAKFHNGLAEGVVAVAKETALARVALSGGCFQNRYLTERTVRRLRAEGFQPYWHQRVPPNDGGIALGQVVAARRAIVNNKP